MNILVLDDDTNIHPYYRYVIRHVRGVGTICLASDEKQFVEMLGRTNFHVIVVDIHMEPKSGPDILRSHKDKLVGKEIIILSCADDIHFEADSLTRDGLQVLAYFQKPLVIEDFVELLSCN